MLTALGRGCSELGNQRGLSCPRRSDNDRACTLLDAAPQQTIEWLKATGKSHDPHIPTMLSSNNSRKDRQSTTSYGVVVIAAAKFNTTELHDSQTAPFCPVFGIELFEQSYTVGNALDLKITL